MRSFQVGQMAGALFIWMADWRGRRQHIFMGTVGVVASSAINATASNLSTFIGSRFLLAFFVTCAHSAAPLYLVELSPPQYRGTVAGLYNTLYYVVSLSFLLTAQLLTSSGLDPCNFCCLWCPS
jgi:MFS family permease